MRVIYKSGRRGVGPAGRACGPGVRPVNHSRETLTSARPLANPSHRAKAFARSPRPDITVVNREARCQNKPFERWRGPCNAFTGVGGGKCTSLPHLNWPAVFSAR